MPDKLRRNEVEAGNRDDCGRKPPLALHPPAHRLASDEQWRQARRPRRPRAGGPTAGLEIPMRALYWN